MKKWICGYLASVLFMPFSFRNTLSTLNKRFKDYENFTPSQTCYMDEYENVNDFILKDNIEVNDFYRKSSVNKVFYSNKTMFLPRATTITFNEKEKKFDFLNFLKKDILKLIELTQKISRKVEEDHEEQEKALYWKFAGMVIDKLFFYIFSILTITSTCAILLSSTNFFKLN